jgi:hypothetical protein
MHFLIVLLLDFKLNYKFSLTRNVIISYTFNFFIYGTEKEPKYSSNCNFIFLFLKTS